MDRLTCDKIAHALGISVTKATQSATLAFYKVAACLREYPAETMAELAIFLKALDEQEQRPASGNGTTGAGRLAIRELPRP